MMPLAGKRIVVTRPRAQAATLAEKLAAQGATAILFPTIELTPMDDIGPLQAALGQLGHYDWVVFTSANAVAVFWREAEGRGVQLNAPVRRFAAVGPATARALESRGLTATFIPDEYVAEALAAGLGEVAGQRILLPHAELAREVLASDLRGHGAVVDEIAVYRTLPATPDPAGLAELRRGVDAVTFTSGSAARNFARVLGGDLLVTDTLTACIGPVTAAAARESGLPVGVVAAEYTLDGLVAALVEYWAQL